MRWGGTLTLWGWPPPWEALPTPQDEICGGPGGLRPLWGLRWGMGTLGSLEVGGAGGGTQPCPQGLLPPPHHPAK